MKIEETQILVTGGSGFLGHHVVKALSARHAGVFLLLQPHENPWRLKALEQSCQIVKARLSDRKAVHQALQTVRPEVIIHFAGRMERRRDILLLDDLTQHHLTNTLNLILAADSATTRLIINTGTSEEYGEQPDPLHESLPPDPVSPYSATKAAATTMAIYLSKATGIPVLTMRPFIVYGPGQIHDTLIPFLIKGVLQKQTVELTEGLQYRDFLYVDDLVACYLAAIEKSESFTGPDIINVGSGQKTRVRDVVMTISELTDGDEYLRIGAKPMRPGETSSMIANIEKARKVLEWAPRIPIRDGIQRTVHWWHANGAFWETPEKKG